MFAEQYLSQYSNLLRGDGETGLGMIGDWLSSGTGVWEQFT